MKRESKWTHIYATSNDKGKLVYYIRLQPTNVDLEKFGFPHGLCISKSFETKEEANNQADWIDNLIELSIKINNEK